MSIDAITLNETLEAAQDLQDSEMLAGDQEAQELESYASLELSARLAYDLSRTDDLNIAKNARAILATQGYTAHPLTLEGPEAQGIYIYAMVPQDQSKPIILAGRGTAGDASVIRDLDPNGAAYNPMTKNRDFLLEQIKALAPNHSKMAFTGHSLGGAIAQFLATFVMSEKVSTEDFGNLKELSLCTFQSTGVRPDVAAEASAAARALAAQDITLSSTTFRRTYDGINVTGEQLFTDLEPEVAKVTLFEENHRDNDFSLSDFNVKGLCGTAMKGAVGLLMGKTLWQAGLNVASHIGYSLIHKMFEVREQAHTNTFFWEKFEGPKTVEQYEGFDVIDNVVEYKRKGGLFSYEGRTQMIDNRSEAGQQALKQRLTKDWVRNFAPCQEIRRRAYDLFKKSSLEEAKTMVEETIKPCVPAVKTILTGYTVYKNFQDGIAGSQHVMAAIKPVEGEAGVVERTLKAATGLETIGNAASNLFNGARRLFGM